MNTTTDHIDTLREVANLLGATSFEDRGHVCHFSRNREWHLFANHEYDLSYYTIGVRIPNEISYDTRTFYLPKQIYPTHICLSKSNGAKILADAISKRLLSAAIEFAKTMWRAEEEWRNFQAISANTIARAAQIIGAKTHAKILNGNLGGYLCTADISGTKIKLSFDDLNADQLAKIAAALSEKENVN